MRYPSNRNANHSSRKTETTSQVLAAIKKGTEMKTQKCLVAYMNSDFAEYVTHGGRGSTNEIREAQRFATMAKAQKWVEDNVLESDLANWVIIPL